MVSRRGAVKRKQRYISESIEEPPLVVNCICCHCEGVFRPEGVTGSYLMRSCPICGQVLDEDAYDAACKTVLEEEAEMKREVMVLEAQDEKRVHWLNRFHWPILRLLLRPLHKKLKRIRDRKDKLNSKRSALKNRRTAYSLSRYYTGEWYQRTRIPLKRTVVDPYLIKVGYGKDGNWNIIPTDKYTAGIVAEFRVFQELLSRIKDPQSSIHRAQILPNIYLPHESRGRKAEKLWSQIDCVLLTRQAAFVIEIKRRKAALVAMLPFEEIWSTDNPELVQLCKDGDVKNLSEASGFRDESFALKQNSNHAVAFDEMCDKYEFERVYEQVVYVGARSFTTDGNQFLDNVNVSCLGHSKPNFADIIEQTCDELDEVLNQGELDESGKTYVQSYGDLNQKRAQLHTNRIMNMARN